MMELSEHPQDHPKLAKLDGIYPTDNRWFHSVDDDWLHAAHNGSAHRLPTSVKSTGSYRKTNLLFRMISWIRRNIFGHEGDRMVPTSFREGRRAQNSRNYDEDSIKWFGWYVDDDPPYPDPTINLNEHGVWEGHPYEIDGLEFSLSDAMEYALEYFELVDDAWAEFFPGLEWPGEPVNLLSHEEIVEIINEIREHIQNTAITLADGTTV